MALIVHHAVIFSLLPGGRVLVAHGQRLKEIPWGRRLVLGLPEANSYILTLSTFPSYAVSSAQVPKGAAINGAQKSVWEHLALCAPARSINSGA